MQLFITLLLANFLFAQQAVETDEHILARVGVCGPSVSSGAGNGIPMSYMLDNAIKTPHSMINLAKMGFGLNPCLHAETAMRIFNERKATLVISADYFFWFCFGPYSSEVRIRSLKNACKIAEKLKCPFMIGDLPDLSGSRFPGASIMAPSSDVTKKLNTMLRKWAAKLPHIYIMPISKWMAAIKSGKPIMINGKEKVYKESEILYRDGVHPNIIGMALLSVKMLEEASNNFPSISKTSLIKEVKGLLKVLKRKKKTWRKKAGKR